MGGGTLPRWLWLLATLTPPPPLPGLRVLAVNILGKFLTNKDNNIKYVAPEKNIVLQKRASDNPHFKLLSMSKQDLLFLMEAKFPLSLGYIEEAFELSHGMQIVPKAQDIL